MDSRRATLGLVAAIVLLACKSRAIPEMTRTESPPPSASHASRAVTVERADRMAAEAARSPGASAAELLERAAELRYRLYRSEHRLVDALEAVENLRARELRGSGCRARLSRTLLEAELKRDPTQAFKQVYADRVKELEPGCRAAQDQTLRVLKAYEPLASVLAELEPESSAAASGASSPPASNGQVVLPETADARSEPARLTKVERYGASDAARVVVSVTHPTRFRVGEVGRDSEHPRLFVDIENATSSIPNTYPVGGLLERVRIGAQQSGVRVVLDLSQAAAHRVFYLPEPFRLVIDLMQQDRVRLESKAGKRRVTRVVLDPGHGGHDPGAVGATGLREKDVVLDVAHRAAPVLARELGISTLLTRDNDEFVALDERTARANAFHADLFISIHCNASEDSKARGVMSFILDVGREELATRIAARENAASSAAAVELANAASRLTDKASRDASAKLADLLQRSAMGSLSQHYADVPNGGVKQAGFYVLAGARMPAVLFETSFISNPAGEARLNNQDFRQKLADAIVNAVRAYRDGL